MSTMTGLRAFNRSQKIRVGGKALSPNQTTLVNLDSVRVQRDLGRHSAIGAIHTSLAPFFQNDDGVVLSGGTVSTSAGSLTVSTTAVYFTPVTGDETTHAADTVALAASDATNPRVDLVALDTSTPNVVKVDGTATAGANGTNLSGKPAVPAGRIALAYVVNPPDSAAGTVEADDDTVTLTAHGYSNGQAVRLTAITGGTGLTAGTVYYVRDAATNTFKLAATAGGAAINVTADGTGATFNVGPSVVVDARP